MIVSGAPRDGTLTPAHLLAVVERRKYLLIFPTLAGLAVGLANYAGTPYSFVSEAAIALDVRRVALPSENVVSPLPQDSPVLRTELDIINSRSMAAKVVARLEREGVKIRDESEPSLSIAEIRGFITSLLPGSAQARTIKGDVVAGDDSRVKVDRLLSGLRVSNDGRSYTIFVTFNSSDPAFAAQAANAYALSYLDHQIDVQRSATRRVSDWLGETLVNLRSDLESSEKAAEDFRQKAGLIETDGVIIQSQRVAALSNELATTRSALAGLEARLATIKTLADSEQFPSLAETLNSQTVQTLRIEEARIERRLRELRDSNATKSSEIATLGSELQSIKDQIGEEIARIVASLTNEMSIARQKEQSLQKALVGAQSDLSDANHAEVTLAQLEREANANRTIYESYLVRYKQTIEQEGVAAPEAQIISFAEPATKPAKPRLTVWLMFGLGLGGSIGVAATLLREATDRRPRLIALLENSTKVPVIGAVPQMARRDRSRMNMIARDTATVTGRAIATLRRILTLVPANKPSPVVVITSASADDGKTTLALALAHSAAAAGIRTVVLDANLRNPAVEATLKIQPHAYLDELLAGGRNVGDLINDIHGVGYSVIAARANTIAPELLFASPRFRTLVNELKLRFDLVLIDAAETTAAAETTELAALANRLIFVVAFKARGLNHVIASIRNLVASGHRPSGIVLNRVDRHSYRDLAEHLIAAEIARIEASEAAVNEAVRQSA